ncbi:hypothetical protein [Sulfurisphaera ohwakuensis]|uniref:hypothetical protein n=1 Tax=Sulfurisphaera ohwakuensis TaxID=69656 RepID=UPI0036F3E92A
MKRCDIYESLNQVHKSSNRSRINQIKKILLDILSNVPYKEKLLDKLQKINIEFSDKSFIISKYKIDKSELEYTKACYINGSIYFFGDNICIQTALHELLHSLQNEKWDNLGIIKEGLIEFLSAFILYIAKNNQSAKQALKCTVSKHNTVCSISERLGYSKGYSFWASIYLKLLEEYKNKEEGNLRLFNEFLRILIDFNSDNTYLKDLLEKLSDKSDIDEVLAFMDGDIREKYEYIEQQMYYNVFERD